MTVSILLAVKENQTLKYKTDAMRHIEVVRAILYFRDVNIDETNYENL